jgi:glucose/arabinose dehydrogenase
MKHLFCIAVFMIAILVAGQNSDAVIIKYTATLKGNNEVPASATSGTGFADIDYDDILHTLSLNVTFSGLSGNVTASHLHSPALPTANAGVATTLPTFPGFPSGVNSGNYVHTLDMTLATSYNPAFITSNGGTVPGAEAALAASLAAGTAYLNIHTNLFPGGEIRGQLGTQILNPIPAKIPKGSISIGLETVVEGLVSPLGLLEPNDGSGRLFVYDQIGKIWILKNGTRLTTPFLDVSASLVSLNTPYDERGLLGFAFHPNFSSNRIFYTYTSQPIQGVADFSVAMTGSPNHQAVISEWTAQVGQTDLADLSSQRVLLRIDQPQFNHNGGVLRFGPDGYLYLALGDGGAGDDQGDGHVAGGNGQSLDNVYGKILRIDVNGSNSTNGQYGIPADNPFVGVPGVDEIYAYGLRNPFSMSFDSLTQLLYVADAGQNNIEEVDLIVKGGNYGWPLKEGSFFFDPNGGGPGFVTTVPVTPLPAGLVDPIAEYDHDDGSVIVGGFVYRGSALPSLTGLYIAGDFGTSFTSPSGRLFYVDVSTGAIREFQIASTEASLGLWLKGFGQDLAGEIYVCGSARLGPDGTTGRIIKLTPPRLFLPLIRKDLAP